MHVLFVEPCFPRNQIEFVRGLVSAGARVTGIGEAPKDALPQSARELLGDYVQVGSVVREDHLLDAVTRCQAAGWVDRLEATVEAHVLTAAKVREARGIPGTSVRTAYLCRDKPAMKEALREAGVPTAASMGAVDADEARAFAERIGYPIIFKPADAAGAAGVIRVDDRAGLEAAIKETELDRGRRVALEEFVEGHEGFFDTLSIGGRWACDFISHYYPNVLDAMRTRWISPQIITTNRLDSEGYGELRAMARKVHDALGIDTTATHMEWFYGPKGLRFSEIGCRPPGVGMWDIYCFSNDFDLYEEWGHAIVNARPHRPPSRRFSGGMIALRPDRDGTITAAEGYDGVRHRHGQWIVDGHMPPAGARTGPVEAGYWANGWLRMRHPDYDTLRAIMDDVGQTLKLRAR